MQPFPLILALLASVGSLACAQRVSLVRINADDLITGRFTCTVDGHTPSQPVSWFRGKDLSDPVTGSQRVTLDEPRVGSLSIRNLAPGDEDCYTCCVQFVQFVCSSAQLTGELAISMQHKYLEQRMKL